MKHKIFIFFLLILAAKAGSQSLGEQLNDRIKNKKNYYEIMRIVDSIYAAGPADIRENGGDGLPKYKHWWRWAWYMSRRLDENGTSPQVLPEDILWELIKDNDGSCDELCLIIGCDDDPTGICARTFKFIPTGTNGYTCQVNGAHFTCANITNNTRGITNVPVGTLCIQVTRQNSELDPILNTEAALLVADAWDEAQDIMNLEYAASGFTAQPQDLKNIFLTNLRNLISARFNGSIYNGTLTVSNSSCSGLIPSSAPIYSFFCD